MPAGILCLLEGFCHGLPGDAEVVRRLIVPDVDVIARPVHGNAVPVKAADAVVLRTLVKGVASRRVVDDCGVILHPQKIGRASCRERVLRLV